MSQAKKGLLSMFVKLSNLMSKVKVLAGNDRTI